MRASFASFSAILVAILIGIISSGCKSEPRGGPRKATFPVRGIVLVDGKPAATLKVECHPVTPDPKEPLIPSALTGPDGKFEIGTYESGDGAPPGAYHLTFIWGEYNLLNGSYGGDKLNGQYAKPDQSEIKATVDNKKVDLGEIALKSK
jgi:hypothetical protein